MVLGRGGGAWAVPWDSRVSRHHVRLLWNGQRLSVVRLPDSRNPVFLHGAERQQFSMAPGEHFVIGQTTFTLTDQRVNITADAPEPAQQQSFSAQYLKQLQFRNPDHRIEVLSRLPEVISGATDDNEMVVRLVSMLLAGAPRADAAAVVAVEPLQPSAHAMRGELRASDDDFQSTKNLAAANDNTTSDSMAAAEVLHWDQRLVITGDFQPSQGLILEAIRQQQSILQVWHGPEGGAAQPFTESDVFDWAFCTPVPGKICAGWGLYVAGRFNVEGSGVATSSDPTDLREDVKFTELVAAMLSSLRQMRRLEHQQTTLSQFFSPVVLETLAVEDPDVVLAPQETDVTVMFCDLRGFSRETERHADDLLGLLNRVSKALGVMTHHIRQQGGVVGDFHGDAAMGFWGWPLAQENAVPRTVRAALGVRADFRAIAQEPGSPLRGFQAGIGIASGRAVAGKIGTVDQVKVTVFGPAVNLASRLEGMTKIFRAPILLDETTAAEVRRCLPKEIVRVRRVAMVRPYGLDTPLVVSELLPPEAEYPELTDEHLQYYETALEAFLAGDWAEAFDLLHRIPTDDQVKDFLTVYIAQHNRTPPPDFDGVVPLHSKL